MHLLVLVLLFFVGNFLWVSSKRTMENYSLASDGELVKGLVTSRIKVGGKGTVRIDYKFHINSKEYVGYTTDEEYQIGDSLFVLYLIKNPQINRSNSFIRENYNNSNQKK